MTISKDTRRHEVLKEKEKEERKNKKYEEAKKKDFKPTSKSGKISKKGIPVRIIEEEKHKKCEEWWFDNTKIKETDKRIEEGEITMDQAVDDFFLNKEKIIEDIKNAFEDDSVEKISYLKQIMTFARRFIDEKFEGMVIFAFCMYEMLFLALKTTNLDDIRLILKEKYIANDGSPVVLLLRARAHLRTKNWDKTVIEFEQFQRLRKHDSEVDNQYGVAVNLKALEEEMRQHDNVVLAKNMNKDTNLRGESFWDSMVESQKIVRYLYEDKFENVIDERIVLLSKLRDTKDPIYQRALVHLFRVLLEAKCRMCCTDKDAVDWLSRLKRIDSNSFETN
jgi:anti-sigma28 factor (negative regulator of flagellin synthesis)